MSDSDTKLTDEEKELLPQGAAAVGRPSDMTIPVVTKLIEAFNNGLSITEACRYSGISRPTYYRWLENDEWFRDKMDEAQGAPNIKAKSVIIQSINDKENPDVASAKWWLERKDPEFRAKGELMVSPGQQATEEKLKEFMNDTNDGAYADTADVERIEPVASPSPDGGEEVAPSTPAIS